MTTPPQPPFAPSQPPQPPRKSRPLWLWIGIPITVVLLLCAGITVLGVILGTGANDGPKPKATHPATVAPIIGAPTTEPTTTPPAPAELTAADITLKVKITKQECFGSAGCNVEFDIDAGWPSEKITDGQRYDVTYEVSGVEDGPQVNTLTITSPTEFEQDSYQSAQTTRHVRTLKVKVTDVEMQAG